MLTLACRLEICSRAQPRREGLGFLKRRAHLQLNLAVGVRVYVTLFEIHKDAQPFPPFVISSMVEFIPL